MHKNFHEFGISDKVLVALSEIGFEEPTPIQKTALPPALLGKDIIGQAQTGTGKTAAFGIPIIEQRPDNKGKYPYAIILAPTRELAVQVSGEINKIGARAGVVCLPIYGGQSIELQIKSMRRGVDVIVGTPGRVIDHIQRKTLILTEIKTVVLDEADEMLNMGFIEDIENILSKIPKKRQTMLFSATISRQVHLIAKKYMEKPVHLNVNTGDMVLASKIKQVFYEVREDDKIKALTRLLDTEGPSIIIVFCHTKREVDEVVSKLQQMGYPAGAIHGDFTQQHRNEMIRRFKNGDVDILVATDVAARGLDIPDVSHVINFSIPQDPEGYIHRVGRTGRAGKSGIAITFVTPRQYRQLKLIEKSAKTIIKKAMLPTVEQVRKAKTEELVNSVGKVIEEKKHIGFQDMANRLLEKYSPEDVSAAIMSMLFSGKDLKETEEDKDTYSSGAKKDVVRLFLTIGKVDKIKVVDIVKSISTEAGIPAQKIGNIAIFDRFSFIEVPENLADKVILAINDSIIKGKKIKIQHANKRERR